MKLPLAGYLQKIGIFLVLFLSCSSNSGFVEGSVAAGAATATSGALSAFKALDYRYFVAGGTCAAFSHGITTPVDVVKTRIQANPNEYDKGMIDATLKICKEDGAQVLLAGLGPTVVGYGIEGAMKFGVYEVMKPIVKQILDTLSKKKATGSGSNTGLAYSLASFVAGAVAALLLCPMESTRIRIVTDPSYANLGLLAGFPKLVKEEGLLSTFAGIWAMLAKQIPYTFGKQVSFDIFAGLLYTFFDQNNQKKIRLDPKTTKWVVSITAAFIASLFACIFSQPGDMILTETYRREEEVDNKGRKNKKNGAKAAQQQQKTFLQVIDTIYGQGGISQFFTGTGARIVHVGLIITSQLVVYDIVKQLLGLPATGSH